MSKKVQIILYILAVILQLTVISSIIFKNNATVASGIELKIKVFPIDPYDPFRGKYVDLNVNNYVSKQNGVDILKNSKVYVTLRTNPDGFSELDTAYITKPKNKPYVETVAARDSYNPETSVYIDNPFKRFYIEEVYSEEAETAYRQNATEKDVYIKVKILDGKSVIEELYIENEPIKEYIDKHRAKKRK